MTTTPAVDGEIIDDDEYVADMIKAVASKVSDRLGQLLYDAMLHGGPVYRIQDPDAPQLPPPSPLHE